MSELIFKLNGVVRSNFVVEKVETGILGTERVVFREEGIRHDEGALVTNDDRVQVRADGATIFDGWVRLNEPQGVAKEGVTYTAYGARWRLENEVYVRVNGSYGYTYNPGGRDSRAPGGGWLGCWTVGEALIDLLEHAMGVPEAGSAIPLHHTGPEDVTDPYLPAELFESYDLEAIRTFTTRLGEFNIQGMRFGDAITLLLMQEGQIGWFIDPWWKQMEFVRVGASGRMLAVTAGELGRYVDDPLRGYQVEDNPLRMSLEEVYTRIVVQGRNKTVEIRPGGLPGGRPAGALGDALLEKGWDPDLEGVWREADWRAGHYTGDNRYEWVYRRYAARSVEQRTWREGRMQDDDGRFYGSGTWPSGEVYVGQETTAKTLVGAAHVTYFEYGAVLFVEPYILPRGMDLWAWYRCEQPFVVTLGPAGSAYTNYGLVSEMVVYEEGFEHKTSRLPSPAGYSSSLDARDDTGRMAELAQRLLSIYGSERVYAEVVLDNAPVRAFSPGSRVNFTCLAKWSNVGLDVMRTILEPATQTTRLLLGNDLVRYFFGGVRREPGKLRAAYEAEVSRQRIRWLENHVPGVEVLGG